MHQISDNKRINSLFLDDNVSVNTKRSTRRGTAKEKETLLYIPLYNS